MAGISLNTNLSALQALGALSSTTSALSSVYQRLSSGLRINQASDDPAGLAVSSTLNANARIYTQAIRNVNDGISLFNIAQGALDQLAHVTEAQLALAEQAANGTYALAQREAMTTQINALSSEFNQIVQGTTFNGQALLDITQTAGLLQVQAGSGTPNTLNLSYDQQLSRTVGAGKLLTANLFTASTNSALASGDFNGDGNVDLVAAVSGGTGEIFTYQGNGNGTFGSAVTIYSSVTQSFNLVAVGDFNGDGKEDIVANDTDNNALVEFMGNGNGTFQGPISLITGNSASPGSLLAANLVTGSTRSDVLLVSSSEVTVIVPTSAGLFTTEMNYVVPPNAYAPSATVGDVDGNGTEDLLVGAGSNVALLLGNGDGSFGAYTTFAGSGGTINALATADLNGDGKVDVIAGTSSGNIEVWLGNGNGTFQAPIIESTGFTSINSVATADENGDGNPDLVFSGTSGGSKVGIALGNGDGTFQSPFSESAPGGLIAGSAVVADFNNDGVEDIATPEYVELAQTKAVTTIPSYDLNTQASAQNALTALNVQLTRVTSELGVLGANESRLNVAVSVVSTLSLGYRGAAATILDADTAQDTAEATRLQVLQQAAAAVLGQANQSEALALDLVTV